MEQAAEVCRMESTCASFTYVTDEIVRWYCTRKSDLCCRGTKGDMNSINVFGTEPNQWEHRMWHFIDWRLARCYAKKGDYFFLKHHTEKIIFEWVGEGTLV